MSKNLTRDVEIAPDLDPFDLLSPRASERYRDYIESGRARQWLEQSTESHKERDRKKRSVFAPGEEVH